LTSANILEGVQLAGMNFGSEVNKGPYSAIPVEIDLEGKYSGLLSYLGQVERFGKLVTADNIDFSVKKEDPSVVNAKVSANIYVVHPADTSGAVPGQAPNPAQPPPPNAGKGK
jgi:Tfp pilus assembly protein PilO